MAEILLKGAKGGSSSFKQTPDNLRSTDTFEGVLGIAIGPLKGPKRGLKSIKLDGTALENETGQMNFGDWVANIGNGDPAAFPQKIQLKLGAGGAPTQVGLTLSNTNGSGTPGVWITKTLVNTNADFIDFRFVVNQLFRQDKNGIYNNTATLEIQMKPVGTSEWINPTIGTPQGSYSEQGLSTGNTKTLVPREYYDAQGQWSQGSPNYSITGKTTSPTVYELRIGTPNEGKYANTGWDVRIRLVEPESVDADPNFEKRSIQWESMSAVYSDTLGDHEDWRGVAWLQLYGKASAQLTGVPEVTGEWETKIVSVPPQSIFNPDNRQYTGAIWDGSWTKAYTNDPAWVINDAISDSLSGISLIASGSYLNKWDALELSKWCSQPVPDGNGGTHPRYSMNIAISEPQKAEEFVRYLAGAVGALAWDQGDGEWRVKADKPESPVDLFTLETIEGEFLYSGTDVDTRYNDIIGQFKNAEMDYRQDAVHLYDNVSIAKIGRKPTTIALVGCTNRQEAMRRIKLRLRSTVNETRIVNFVTNRRGRNVNPLDMILIADGDMGELDKRTHGRLVDMSDDRKQIVLRDPVYLAPGVSYTLRFAVVNPDYDPEATSQPTNPDWRKPTKVVSRTIVNTSSQTGSVRVLYLDQPLPEGTAENLSVALEAANLPAVPKLYRVTSVAVQDDGERVAIAAIEVDAGKWDASDNVSKEDTVFQDLRGVVPMPLPPIDGQLLSLIRVPVEQGSQVSLVANWIRPAGAFISGFKFSYRISGGAWMTPVDRTQFSTVELVNPTPGKYEVNIQTIDRRGGLSEPLVAYMDVTQELIDATQIKYANGDTLEQMKPAQPGADVTGDNTSKDSNALGGKPAAEVIKDIADTKQNVIDVRGELDRDIAGVQADIAAAKTELTSATNEAKSAAAQAQNDAASARSDASTARDDAANARSTASGVKTDLAQEVERAKGAEGTITTKVTQAQGRADEAYSAVSTETTNRANADSALANRLDTVESNYGNFSSRLTEEATTRANADSAAASRTSALESRASGAGNLLSNTTFAGNSYAGWTPYGPMAGYSVNEAGDNWHPVGENVVGHHTTTDIGATGMGSGGGWYSDPVTVNAGRFYQFYAFLANHRALAVELMVEFLNENNGVIQTLYSGGQQTNNGGRTASNWTQLGWKSVQAPAGSAAVRFHLSKWGTVQGEGNSYFWFWRPYIGEARQGQVEWNPYSPGSGRTGTELALARVADEATTRVSNDAVLANRISTTEAQLRGDQDSTLAARVRDEATARANQDGALANRISTNEAKITQLAEIFRVQSAGNVANNSPFGKTGALYYADGSVAVVGGRSYTVVTFATDSNTIDYANLFDVYGDDNARAQMADKLNSIPSGKTVIIFTVDEPWNGHLGRGLDTAMAAVGAGEAFFSPNFKQWSAYILVGRGQAGRGNGVEYYAGKYDQDPNAFLDVNIPMLKGRPAVGSNSGAFQIRAALDDEITVRANQDGALSNRISTTEAQMNGSQGSALLSKISDETTARVNQDSALSNRISTTESSYTDLNAAISGALFPGFENTSKSWGYDTAWGGRNVGATWETGAKGSALSFTTPASGERWIYMDTPNALIPVVRGRKYRAGFWVWQWGAPNGYGGNPRVYWEGFDVNKTNGQYLDRSANSPEATKSFYEPISDGSFQCYASDFYVNFDPLDASTVAWVRPRINIDNMKPSSGYQISGWFFREVTDDVRTNSRVSDEITTRANADGALSNRISTTEAQLNGAQGSTLLSRITDETTARVNQDSALANRASALEVRGAFSGGNLVPQTSFIDLSGWTYGSYGMTWDTRVINGAGDTWHPVGENVLSIHELGRGADDAYFDHAIDGKIAVDSNNFYQFYAFVAAHRAKVAVHVSWHDENNNFIANTYQGDYDAGGGGRDLKNWSIIGNMSVRPPANAASAQFYVRKRVTNAGEGDSWMWFCRPYFGRARENQNEWNAFTHGSNTPLATSTRARIADEETARANADSAIAGRVTTVESSVVNLNNGLVQANSRITDEITTRSNQDSALANRISTTEAQLRGDQDSTLAARVRDEATARANQDGALAGRISSTEAQFTRMPVQFRVTSRGAAASNAPFGETRFVTPDGNTYWTGGRSYLVIVFDPNSNNVGYANTFDVFGDGNAPANMASVLNGIGLGQTVVIATNDEPQNNRFNSGLDAAMARVGAGEAFFSASFKYRSAYVLVGRAGIGRGNGVEFYKGDSDNDPNAFIDQYIPMLNGKAVLGSNAGTTQNRAAISDEAYVRANADGALSSRISSVEATANGASSQASVALSAAQDAQSRLGQARVRLLANAGNGRAQFDLFSDSYGNAGADLVGDLRILGQNGGYSLELASQKGFTMKNSQGQAFIELGIFG